MNLKQYTKEFSYNLKLAYPVILGMLGHTLIAIVDNIMVGNLGSTELAAVSLGSSFVFIGMSIGIGFSTAITPLDTHHHSISPNDPRNPTYVRARDLQCVFQANAIAHLRGLRDPRDAQVRDVPEDVLLLESMPDAGVSGAPAVASLKSYINSKTKQKMLPVLMLLSSAIAARASSSAAGKGCSGASR